jgi:hypothetical protein
MGTPYTTSSGRWTGTVVALLGAGLCVASAMGRTEAACFTDGCALFQDYTFFGVSLWWWGVVGFLAIALPALFGATRLAFSVACLALIVDVGLLAWMALSAPCATCLLAALFFLGAFMALLPPKGPGRKAAKVLALVWALTFSPNLFAAVQEPLSPWPLYGNADAPVRVFFSPNCPACRDTVADTLRYGKNAALFPVAESDKDMEDIQKLTAALATGQTFANAFAALAAPGGLPAAELGMLDNLRLRLHLSRNRVALLRAGADRVPFSMVSGRPESSRPAIPAIPALPQAPATTGAPSWSPSATPDNFLGCPPDASGEECDENEPEAKSIQ